MNEEFWTEKYFQKNTGWDVGYPSPALMKYTERLDTEVSILIPGAGYGHEAIALASQGYTNITVIDIALPPLQSIRAKDKNNKIRTIHQDFFNHEEQYDLILEQTFFCALDPSLRKRYVEQMFLLLKPNSILAGVLFSSHFSKIGPPFGGNIHEYRELFETNFHIKKMEPCYNSIPPRMGNELFIELIKR